MTPPHSPLPPALTATPPGNGVPPPAASTPARPAEPAPLPPALSAPPGLDTLVNVVRRRGLRVIGLALLAGAVCASAAWAVVPGRYSAQMKLRLTPPRPRPGEGDFDPLAYQRTQAALFKSYLVIDRALADGRLAPYYDGLSREEFDGVVQKDLVVDFPDGPTLMRVVFAADRPDGVVPVMERLTDSFKAECKEKDDERIKQDYDLVDGRYKKAAQELSGKRQELVQAEIRAGVRKPEAVRNEETALQTALATLMSVRTQEQLKLAPLEAELRQIALYFDPPWYRPAHEVPVSVAEVEARVDADPRLKQPLEEVGKVQVQIDAYRKLAGPGGVLTPATQRLVNDLLEQQAQILRGVASLRDQLRQDAREKLRVPELAKKRQRADELQAQLSAGQRNLANLDEQIRAKEEALERVRRGPPGDQKVAAALESMREEVDQLDRIVKKLGDELGGLEVERATSSQRVAVLERPVPPTSPKNDRRLKFAGLSFLGGFALVFLGLALVEHQKRRLYAAEEVSRGLGLPVVGTLPEVSPSARRPLVDDKAPSAEQSALLEAVDAARAALLHATHGEPLRVLAVTSPKGSEGKTSLACHLAASLARSWRNVLLIDADLRQPSVHTLFDLEQGPGFAEVLRDETDVEEAVRPTALARLSVLPAGRCDRAAIEALSQWGLPQQLTRLREHFDFVILDVNPVLASADASQVAPHADAVLLSVACNVSRLPEVHEARERLAALGVRVLGAVVCGVK